MNLDEFAFFNQQLAGMLQSGLPLEGSLERLSREMAAGTLRDELQRLSDEMKQGVAPTTAMTARKGLPELYRRLFVLGVQGNNLPEVLTMAADHYRQRHILWMRLRTVVFYPAIVLVAALLLSVLIAILFHALARQTVPDLSFDEFTGQAREISVGALLAALWSPVLFLAALVGACSWVLLVPRWRQQWRWRIPPFREAGLANMANSLAMLLERGCPLPEAVAGLAQLEAGSPMGAELRVWEQRLAAGCRRFPELTAGGRIVPPLFTWLVAGDGENWPAGFRHAAEVYASRALYRMDLVLFAILPVAIVALGTMILVQAAVLLRLMGTAMQIMGNS